MSDISHVIPMEGAPDKNKKISEIVCSPNLKYVAALYEDDNISLWPIEQPDKIINIGMIHTKKNGEKIFAISNKYISYSLYRDKPYNFKILDFENKKEVLLKFPDCQNEIDYLSFIDNGNVIMVNDKYYRAYVYSIKDNISWDCKLMIELKYFKKIYITPKGKLIIFNDTIYEITMWDVEGLSIKTHILIDWNFTPEFIEISNDEELLAICAKNEITKDTNLYIFSTKTGINLSFFTTKMGINRIHLIASRKGERLFFTSNDVDGDYYNLLDPYILRNPIDASKLFKKDETQIKEPYIIRSDKTSDKIIFTIGGNVLINELVPEHNNWINYLRKELRDTNRITLPSKNTIDIINKLIEKPNVDKKEFQGELLKWGLEIEDKSVKLTVTEYNYRRKKWVPKNPLEILPSFYPHGESFILSSEVLENDDFITITHIGVIIWTYRNSEIKMHYYWNYWNGRLEQFEFETLKFKSLLKDWTPGRILPASNYETIYKNLDIIFCKEGDEEENQLFKMFLEDNIKEKFYLTCYGNIIMKTFIELNDDKWIRLLGQNCIGRCIKENKHLIPKISLLSIIFENFKELSEDHPAFIASTLSAIGFVVASNIVIQNSTSSHLSSYGRYYHLSKTSFLDILISILWNIWVRFQEGLPVFQDLVVKPIFNFDYVGNSSTILAIPIPGFAYYSKDYNFWKELNDSLNTYNTMDPSDVIEDNSSLTEYHTEAKNMFMMMSSAISAVYLMLTGYKKPYISKALQDILALPEEEPSNTEIASNIKDLKNSMKGLRESIKELRESHQD
ncbi:4323_t:CDS:2 [Cetraspora pellucida]|uniref:4323_t:CDS:1 n=1 Tax=Cetraspora pellucida TaxID=1433469 RepID=A0ACA9MSV1_9GLOM|nr:4323_t:CDS:2 [Cetraspora pellucida]